MVILLATEPAGGGFWVYTYSPRPGQVVELVTVAGPGMLQPTDPIYASIVTDLVKGPP